MRLKDKVVIVTGSARGMGRVMALRCAAEGAKLTVCDVLDAHPVAREIEASGGVVLALKTDISSEAATQEMARKTYERFGRIDVIVNNAAIIGGIEIPDFMKPLEQLTPADWDRILEVNVKGTFLCCKAVIPYMKAQKKGTIVNISSTTAFTGSPAFLHYSTSKGATLTLTRGLAAALGEFNINVNAVAPGAVMTEAMKALIPDGAAQNLLARQVLKKPIQPEDIAAAVLFLASDEASMITGQTLPVNGGEYMN
jgi:NAD(P)-dependent dehydrogenase (short-subunit alcohol dehydrogenase family)